MVLAACFGRGLHQVEAEPQSFVGHFLPTAYGASFVGCRFRSRIPDECLAPLRSRDQNRTGWKANAADDREGRPGKQPKAPPREVEATLWRKWRLQDVVKVCVISGLGSIRGAQPIELQTTPLVLHAQDQ